MTDTVTTLAQKLRPFWLRDLAGGNTITLTGGGGGGLAEHDLDGIYHTGELAESQATWAGTKAELTTHALLADVHHARSHEIFSALDHTITSAALGLIGAVATNTMGLITPSSDVGTVPVAAVLTSTGTGQLGLASLFTTQAYSLGGFNSGFAGYGWLADVGIVEAGKSSFETDNLTVRGRMRVYELLIQQIRATNGSVFVSSASKVIDVTVNAPGSTQQSWTVNGEQLTLNNFDAVLLFASNPLFLVNGAQLTFNGDNAEFDATFYDIATATSAEDLADKSLYHGFLVGDVIRSQEFKWDGSGFANVTQSNVEVTSVVNLYQYGAAWVSGDNAAVGMDFVRLGSASETTRQGSVYLTADDSGAPFIDIVDGVRFHSDWNTAGKIKARLGKLSGISDSDFGGALSGYGLYSQNVYLKGKIVISAGSGYSNISDKPTSLAGINSGEGAKLTGVEAGATAGATWGTNLNSIPATLVTPSGTGLFLSATNMGYYTGGAWKTYIDASGNMILGDIAGGGTGLAWNQGTGVLSIKGAITLTNTIAAGSVTGLAATATSSDFSGVTGVTKPADNATVGAIWSGVGANLSGIPATLGAPSGTGLFLSATHMGYYTGGAWKTYMDSSGNLQLGDFAGGNAGMIWSQGLGILSINGSMMVGSTNKMWFNQGNDGVLAVGGAVKATAPFYVDELGFLTSLSCNITGTVTASAGGVTGSWYAGSSAIRLGTDGQRFVLPNITTIGVTTIPTHSSALRWFYGIDDTFVVTSNYTGLIGYRDTTLNVVDMLYTSYVGETEYTTYNARMILQAGHQDNAHVYTDCRLEVVREAGSGAKYVGIYGDRLEVNGAIGAGTVTAPGASWAGGSLIYTDTSDGDLKVRFANGTVKTLATN